VYDAICKGNATKDTSRGEADRFRDAVGGGLRKERAEMHAISR
jgi:hypothetical protein